jgi:hypothetical protein
MAALPQTNISISAVKTKLGETTNSLFNLCSSSLINKWSKYKPIVGSMPAGTSGYYGLTIGSANPNKWNAAGILDTARLGDFRGYEHDQSIAYPPIFNITSDNNVRTLNPAGTPADNYFVVKIDNTASDYRIVPSDLGFDDYYYGIMIQIGSGAWQYKSFGLVSDGTYSGAYVQVIAFLEKNGSVWSYRNLPYGEGTYNYQLFISSAETAAAPATNGWTTTQPAGYITLPSGTVNGSAIGYSGSFTVAPWILLDPITVNFPSDATYGDFIEVSVLSATNTGFFLDYNGGESWYEIKVWDTTLSQYLTDPNDWLTNICKIHIMYSGGSTFDTGVATFLGPGGSEVSLRISKSDPWISPVIDMYLADGSTFTLTKNQSTTTNYTIFIDVCVEGWSTSYADMYFEVYRGAEFILSDVIYIKDSTETRDYWGGGTFEIPLGQVSGASGQVFTVTLGPPI